MRNITKRSTDSRFLPSIALKTEAKIPRSTPKREASKKTENQKVTMMIRLAADGNGVGACRRHHHHEDRKSLKFLPKAILLVIVALALINWNIQQSSFLILLEEGDLSSSSNDEENSAEIATAATTTQFLRNGNNGRQQGEPASSSTSSVSKHNNNTKKILVHQILPKNTTKYEKYIQSWKDLLGDRLEYRVWNDDDVEQFMKNDLELPDIYKSWKNFKRSIERIDFARYAILYKQGGIYVDGDQELVNVTSLERVLEWVEGGNDDNSNHNTVVLPFEQGGVWNAQQVGQAFMVSPRISSKDDATSSSRKSRRNQQQHSFWYDLMYYLVEKYDPNCNVLLNTGPLAITYFWNTHQSKYLSGGGGGKHDIVKLTRLLDGQYDWKIFPHSATVHHMSGSWNTNPTEFQQGFENCKHRVTYNCTNCEMNLSL